MSDRPGKSRPMPAAPFDDESIPVLTERLTLPALDLDITLPQHDAAAAEPAHSGPTAAAQDAVIPDAAAPAPAVLGTHFESDTWLVETIPMAPAPLDLSTLDLPSFDLPPLTPAAAGPAPPPAAPAAAAAAPVGIALLPLAPSPAPAPVPGLTQADRVIPASLMRTPAAASSPATKDAAASIETAPPFAQPRRPALVEPLPAFDPPAPETAAVAAAAPTALPDETQLRAATLAALSRLSAQDLEAIVRRPLAPAADAAIDAAVALLVPELRRALTQALSELVEHAVKAELARLREPQ